MFLTHTLKSVFFRPFLKLIRPKHKAATNKHGLVHANTRTIANAQSQVDLISSLSLFASHQSPAKQQIQANRLAFLIPGLAMASWSPLIPFVQSNFTLGESELGLLLMCLTTGAGSAVFIAPMLISILGCKNTVRIFGALISIALISITIVPHVLMLGLILLLFGLMLETVSMAANLNAVKLEHAWQKPLLSSMHGYISIGNIAGVLLVTAMLNLKINIPLPLATTAIILSVGILLFCSQIASKHLLDKTACSLLTTEQNKQSLHEEHTLQSQRLQEEQCILQSPSTQEAQNSQPKLLTQSPYLLWQQALTQPLLWLLGMMCLVIYITEDSINDWSGLYLHQTYQVAMQDASFGFLAFATMMALSRFFGDRLVLLFGRKQVLLYGALLTASGLALACAEISSIVSICGFALVGLGTANIAPQCISYAATIRSLPQHYSVFTVNGIGAVGSLFGPIIIGQVSATLSLQTTFLLIACTVMLMAVLNSIALKKPISTQVVAGYHTLTSASYHSFTVHSTSRLVLSCHQALNTFAMHTPTRFEVLPERFALLENPWLSWQKLSLQHWVLNIEEPPSILKA